jgi:S-adenosylmethionine synthetase
VDSFGTSVIPEDKIKELIRAHFELKPKGTISTLNLLNPIYKKTAAYGHFGRSIFPWEKTDKADSLKKDAGL